MINSGNKKELTIPKLTEKDCIVSKIRLMKKLKFMKNTYKIYKTRLSTQTQFEKASLGKLKVTPEFAMQMKNIDWLIIFSNAISYRIVELNEIKEKNDKMITHHKTTVVKDVYSKNIIDIGRIVRKMCLTSLNVMFNQQDTPEFNNKLTYIISLLKENLVLNNTYANYQYAILSDFTDTSDEFKETIANFTEYSDSLFHFDTNTSKKRKHINNNTQSK